MGGDRRVSADKTKADLIAELEALQRANEALRESHEHLSVIADNLPGMVFRRINHANGRVSYPYISARHQEILGFDARKAESDPGYLMRITHPDDRAGWQEALSESARNLTPLDAERRVTTISGEVKWFRAVARPHRLDNGDVVFDGIVLDVTSRREVERALRDTEARLGAIVGNAPAVICLKDRDGAFVFANDLFAALFGFTVDEVMGKTSHDLFPEEIASPMVAQDRAVLESVAVVEREQLVLTTDGPRTYVDIKFPVLDPSGRPVAVGLIGTDVTVRTQAEEALRESEARLKAVVENSPSQIYLKDLEGRYLLVNKTHAEGMGLRPEEAVGRTALDWVPKRWAEAYAAHDREVIESGEAVTREIEVPLADGSVETHIAT